MIPVLITLLIIAGAATAVGGGLALVAQRRRSLPEGGPAGARLLAAGDGASFEGRTLRQLRVGDVIQHDGRDFLVEGLVAYDEDGHRWVAGRLIDGRDERWLYIGLDRAGPDAPRLVTPTRDIDLGGYPPEMITTQEARYTVDRRGTATARFAGDVGDLSMAASGGPPGSVLRCRWWRYEGAGGHCLLVEQWGDDYRVLVGRRAGLADLEMIPGS